MHLSVGDVHLLRSNTIITDSDKLYQSLITLFRIKRVCIASDMDEFFGKRYVLVDSENFEDYLTFIGVGYFPRKVALKLSQTQILTRNDDGTYTYQFLSPMANTTITFTSGVEFEELKADGTKVQAVITIVDNLMIHIQTDENGKISQHVREFYADKMTVTTTVEGLDKIVKRHYVVEQLPTEGADNSIEGSINGNTGSTATTP